MNSIYKSNKLNNVHYEIRGKALNEANKMQDENIDIIKLNIGNPAAFNFRAREEVLKCIYDNINKAQGYSDSKGIIEARHVIQEYCEKKNIQNVKVDDIYIGNGVSELIIMSMQALLNKEDEILIPSPDYPLWTAAATFAGGNVIHYYCDEKSEWNPDINDIKNKITAKTKAIVIINPNNPTGAVYSQDVLSDIVEIARKNNLIIFSDEIYDRLVMDNVEHISIASIAPDLCTITFNGLSKSDMVAGFRVGWMCISGDKTKVKDYIEGLNLLASMRICSNVPAQFAIIEALKNTDYIKEILKPEGRIYEQRETICNELKSIEGISFVKPKAAFYIFPKIDIKRFNIKDDEKFILDFLHQEKVLMVQGSGLNWDKPDHFRITYLEEKKILKIAMQRLKKFLENYNQ